MNFSSDLQEALQKIAQLGNSPIALEQFFQTYLQLLAVHPWFRGCAIWMQHGGEFALFGGSDTSAVAYESSPTQKKLIQELVSRCGSSMQSVVAFPSGTMAPVVNETPNFLLFTPLVAGTPGGPEPLQGVQMVWFPQNFPTTSLQQAADFFAAAGSQCALVLRNNRLARTAEALEQLQRMVKLLSSITGELELDSLGVKMVNLCHEIIGCERCAIFLPPRKGEELRLLAVSHMSTPEPKSALLRCMAMAAKEVLAFGSPTVYKKKSEKTEQVGSIGDFFFYTDSEALAAIPLKVGDQPVGILMAEFREFADNENHRLNLALSVAHHCAPSVRSADLLDGMPFRKPLRRVQEFLLEHPDVRRRLLRKRVLIPGAIFLFLVLCPWSLDVAGDCVVYPRERVMVVAEVSGVLNEVSADNGQHVEAGQPLAKQDDMEIRRQLEVLGQEASRFSVEADRFRNLDDRAQARVAELQLERVRRQIDYWQDQLAKTTLRSPMSGVLYAPHLREAIGTLLQPGTSVGVVGKPDSWELVIKLPESDVGAVASRLQDGKTLRVRYILSSLPTKKFQTELTSPDQISPFADVVKNRNVFEVRLPLPPTPEQEQFRYGYEGRAKIHLGVMPAGYLVLRAFINWLRIHVFL